FASAPFGVAAFAAATAGSVLGFLVYNRHPAKLFMGDTGSLALGAALAGGAILTGTQLLLPLIGGVFAAETLSVIIQVASYKTTRRRVFRMSPLHHHFELAGWPETKVTSRFWLSSVGPTDEGTPEQVADALDELRAANVAFIPPAELEAALENVTVAVLSP